MDGSTLEEGNVCCDFLLTTSDRIVEKSQFWLSDGAKVFAAEIVESDSERSQYTQYVLTLEIVGASSFLFYVTKENGR